MSSALLLDKLGVSPATLKRDIAYLRDRLNTPVVFDREGGGYRLDRDAKTIGDRYELPGLWFSAEEIYALLTMQQLLENLDAGDLLGPHIEPLMHRLLKLLNNGTRAGTEVARRIRVENVGTRKVHLPHFQALGSALLRRQRLVIGYLGRSTAQASEREVSPQRLIHYRGNWYLDAWCHLRDALRRFSVDAVQRVQAQDEAAIDVPDDELDALLGSGYGIFAGRDVQWATLRFSAERARWVAAETWHPKQEGRFEADGRYVLRLPFVDPRELVMDVMRYVPDVEVVGPMKLRNSLKEKLSVGLQQIDGRLTF